MSQIKYWNLKEHKPRLSIKALPLTKSSISVQTFLLKKFQFGVLFPRHKPKRARFWNLPRNFSGKLNIWIQTGQIEKFLDLKRATPSMFMFRYITFSFILREPKFKGQFEFHEFLMCERLRARIFFYLWQHPNRNKGWFLIGELSCTWQLINWHCSKNVIWIRQKFAKKTSKDLSALYLRVYAC